MSVRVVGEGEFGVLLDDVLALFRGRDQALAYAWWLIRLDLEPSYWEADQAGSSMSTWS